MSSEGAKRLRASDLKKKFETGNGIHNATGVKIVPDVTVDLLLRDHSNSRVTFRFNSLGRIAHASEGDPSITEEERDRIESERAALFEKSRKGLLPKAQVEAPTYVGRDLTLERALEQSRLEHERLQGQQLQPKGSVKAPAPKAKAPTPKAAAPAPVPPTDYDSFDQFLDSDEDDDVFGFNKLKL